MTCIYHVPGPVYALFFTLIIYVISYSLPEGSNITCASPQKPKIVEPSRGQLKIIELVKARADFQSQADYF